MRRSVAVPLAHRDPPFAPRLSDWTNCLYESAKRADSLANFYPGGKQHHADEEGDQGQFSCGPLTQEVFDRIAHELSSLF